MLGHLAITEQRREKKRFEGKKSTSIVRTIELFEPAYLHEVTTEVTNHPTKPAL